MIRSEFCAQCGRQCRPNDRFCRGCGQALVADVPAGGPEPIAEAEALAANGSLAEAIATIQRAIGTDDDPALYVSLATLYLRRGSVGDAGRALDRAIDLDPRCGVAHAFIGGMMLHAGRVEEARERLELARELAPDDLAVRIKCAEYWLRLGILDNARAELRHGLQDGGGSPYTRTIAEAMYAAVEKRSRNAFVRKTVALPSLGGLRLSLRRRNEVPAAATESEVTPWP